ncbi:MAG: HD domain-containing protein, partial [Bacteroidia bacterium]|nr:HD domain-containing protein [Bacteroidia bacterium]
MGNKSEIEKKVSQYVKQLLADKLDKKRVYHSLDHTQRIVAAVDKIAEGNGLDDKEKQKLRIAAWFHDTGYIT